MDWTRFESMDIDLLVGVVNTALRDYHGTLDELCLSEDVDKAALCKRLSQGGYRYSETVRQFR